jgi:hypothetical protein
LNVSNSYNIIAADFDFIPYRYPDRIKICLAGVDEGIFNAAQIQWTLVDVKVLP